MSRLPELGIKLCTFILFIPWGIWSYQGFEWLQDGVWYPQTLGYWLELDGIAAPRTNWIAVQRIVDEVLNFPVAIVFISAFIIVFVLLLISRAAIERIEGRTKLPREL